MKTNEISAKLKSSKTTLTLSDTARGKAAYCLDQAETYLAIYREECRRGDLKEARKSIGCAARFLQGVEVAVKGIEDGLTPRIA